MAYELLFLEFAKEIKQNSQNSSNIVRRNHDTDDKDKYICYDLIKDVQGDLSF